MDSWRPYLKSIHNGANNAFKSRCQLLKSTLHSITDKPKILFRFQEEYGTEFIVEKNRPLDIVLDNFFAVHAWCLKFYYTGPGDVLIKDSTYNGTSDSVMGVPKVTDNMIAKWWCVVLQRHKVGKPYHYLGHNYTAQNIVFNLRAKAEVKSTLMDIIYISCGIGVATILLVITVILSRIFCCKQSNKPPLQFTIDPDSVFYLNLEIFRQQYERELQAQQEPVYEEID